MKEQTRKGECPFPRGWDSDLIGKGVVQPIGWWRNSLGSPEPELSPVAGQRLEGRVG